MNRLILTFFILCSVGEGCAQVAISQHFSTAFGQTAFSLPKAAKLYQNTLFVGNHIEYGITNSTSIGIGVCPVYLKQTGFQIFNAVNISQTFKFTEHEALRLGAVGGLGFAPKYAELTDFGGLYALYSRKISEYDLITVGYGYFGSSTYFPPYLHQVNLNHKHAFKNSRLGVEVGAAVGWSQSNWGFEDWGTIWRVFNFRPTLVLTKKFDTGNSVFLGISGLKYADWAPSSVNGDYGFIWPSFGYSRYF